MSNRKNILINTYDKRNIPIPIPYHKYKSPIFPATNDQIELPLPSKEELYMDKTRDESDFHSYNPTANKTWKQISIDNELKYPIENYGLANTTDIVRPQYNSFEFVNQQSDDKMTMTKTNSDWNNYYSTEQYQTKNENLIFLPNGDGNLNTNIPINDPLSKSFQPINKFRTNTDSNLSTKDNWKPYGNTKEFVTKNFT
ncbi:hypothetical protein SNEBB_004373 [Seison nebaliae]|nr:hypothetical protein SNEBB_004373 [Seison nebaliae]